MRKKMNLARSMLIVLWVSAIPLTAGCSKSEPVDWLVLPVHPEAREVREVTFEGNFGHQVYYFVDRPYPYDGVIEHYAKSVPNDWVGCKGGFDAWDGYGDVANGNDLYIHTRGKDWVHFPKGRLLKICVRYQSEGHAYRKIPDNSRQDVFVVEYREDNIKEQIKRLSLNCEQESGASNNAFESGRAMKPRAAQRER